MSEQPLQLPRIRRIRDRSNDSVSTQHTAKRQKLEQCQEPPTIKTCIPSQETGFTGSPQDWFQNVKFNKITTESDKDPYFRSYGHLYIHEIMIRDEARTDAYFKAICGNPEVFKDKVVLDVGCGSGILSIFAAKAGAKKVYAVDNSSIHLVAKEMIKLNNFQEIIEVINGKIEEIQLPVDKVDIIISEWMGYFLIFEGMLESVLYARDRYLKEDGLLFPNKCRIKIAGFDDQDYQREKFHFWTNNKYGLNMTNFKDHMSQDMFVETVPDESVFTESCIILDVDLHIVKNEDLEFTSEYKLKVSQDYGMQLINFTGIVGWFEVDFDYPTILKEKIVLSTSPFLKTTHWKHQTMYLKDDNVQIGMYASIKGSIAVSKYPQNHRGLQIKLSFNIENDVMVNQTDDGNLQDLQQDDEQGSPKKIGQVQMRERSTNQSQQIQTETDNGSQIKSGINKAISEVDNKSSDIGNSMTDFKILSELGRGSYGTVFKVQSAKDGGVYVLKKILMKHMKQKHQVAALKEVQILKTLDHPNIIKQSFKGHFDYRYHTSFMEDDSMHIVMEYAEKGDLYRLLKEQRQKRKYFSEKDLWDFAYQICISVEYLHIKNIMHRDIKCLNIFLTDDRKIKIGDLGVSKIVQSQAALQGTRVGTPLYLSPELVKQNPYDFKVDIWAIGCALYHLASLEPPFQGDNLITLGNNIVNKKPKSLPQIYSSKLINFIDKLLQKRPIDRPTAKEAVNLIPTFVKQAQNTGTKFIDDLKQQQQQQSGGDQQYIDIQKSKEEIKKEDQPNNKQSIVHSAFENKKISSATNILVKPPLIQQNQPPTLTKFYNNPDAIKIPLQYSSGFNRDKDSSPSSQGAINFYGAYSQQQFNSDKDQSPLKSKKQSVQSSETNNKFTSPQIINQAAPRSPYQDNNNNQPLSSSTQQTVTKDRIRLNSAMPNNRVMISENDTKEALKKVEQSQQQPPVGFISPKLNRPMTAHENSSNFPTRLSNNLIVSSQIQVKQQTIESPATSPKSPKESITIFSKHSQQIQNKVTVVSPNSSSQYKPISTNYALQSTSEETSSKILSSKPQQLQYKIENALNKIEEEKNGSFKDVMISNYNQKEFGNQQQAQGGQHKEPISPVNNNLQFKTNYNSNQVPISNAFNHNIASIELKRNLSRPKTASLNGKLQQNVGENQKLVKKQTLDAQTQNFMNQNIQQPCSQQQQQIFSQQKRPGISLLRNMSSSKAQQQEAIANQAMRPFSAVVPQTRKLGGYVQKRAVLFQEENNKNIDNSVSNYIINDEDDEEVFDQYNDHKLDKNKIESDFNQEFYGGQDYRARKTYFQQPSSNPLQSQVSQGKEAGSTANIRPQTANVIFRNYSSKNNILRGSFDLQESKKNNPTLPQQYSQNAKQLNDAQVSQMVFSHKPSISSQAPSGVAVNYQSIQEQSQNPLVKKGTDLNIHSQQEFENQFSRFFKQNMKKSSTTVSGSELGSGAPVTQKSSNFNLMNNVNNENLKDKIKGFTPTTVFQGNIQHQQSAKLVSGSQENQKSHREEGGDKQKVPIKQQHLMKQRMSASHKRVTIRDLMVQESKQEQNDIQ